MSSVLLPQPIASSSQWQLVDWVDNSYTSAAAAGGLATIQLPQLAYNERWQLTHMVIGCSSSATTTLRLYLNTVANGSLRDGSPAGNFDVADWTAGLMIPPSSALIAQWAGCSDGSVATMTLQANLYRLAGT